MPAHFCWDAPVTYFNTETRPMLICPAGEFPASTPAEHVDRIAALVGRTRARLLAELTVPASTARLATWLSVTPAAISQHTKILREAGLLTTSRLGASVQHALTPLGQSLLRAG